MMSIKKMLSSGKRFRDAIKKNKPLKIVGTVNAYCASLAQQQGHQAIYISGAGVANASYNLPDLGLTGLQDVLIDVRRITGTVDCPLLVDIDTGWGDCFGIARTIREMIQAGAGAVHIEDQVAQKRCGHRPNKELVTIEEMQDRIKAAVDARTDDDFVIMARTDARAKEGLDAAIHRLGCYVEAGADMIFPEAFTSLAEYQHVTESIQVPILANITEFSEKAPLFNCDELAQVGIAMALYPLSAFRAMSQSAIMVYKTIAQTGSQQSILDSMQSRAELYQCLGYEAYEQVIDRLFVDKNNDRT